MYKIAITDDHTLLRTGLTNLINTFDGFAVAIQACHGKDLIRQLDPKNLPDLALMDINMPEMDGFETTEWLSKTFPLVRVLALSMMDNESSIIRMIKNGARGYVLKDCEPQELKNALTGVLEKGYYYNDLVTGKLIFSVNKMGDDNPHVNQLTNLSPKETLFLKLICTDLTYKEIADEMNVGARTVDGYRDNLFEKLQLKSRVSLAMFAIKNGFVQL